MNWKVKTKNLVIHRDGHSIELKAGSWRDPYEIHPKIVKGTPALETVKLIREGIEYATKNVRVPERA